VVRLCSVSTIVIYVVFSVVFGAGFVVAFERDSSNAPKVPAVERVGYDYEGG
jgi:hypothetical protein